MAKPILPTPDNVLAPGIDALVALRPRALSHINGQSGTYAKVFAGWRAQVALMLRRLSAEVSAARLSTSGAELIDLAHDEYDTTAPSKPTHASGSVTLQRPIGSYPGGVIRKGTKFRRDADDSKIPAIKAAVFEVALDVPLNHVVAVTSLTYTVPLVAQRAGDFANAPLINGAAVGTLQIADTLFSTAFTVATNSNGDSVYDMAGGSDGEDDASLRREAGALLSGQYAPTRGAVLAGALQQTGVRHVAVVDMVTDSFFVTSSNRAGTMPYTAICVADSSWAGSPRWAAAVQQQINSDWNGFGCVANVSYPSTVLIQVAPQIALRDSSFLAFTQAIDVKVQAAVKAYFDDRPDWFLFKAAQLAAAITRCDRRILTCTSVAVTNMATGAAIADPTMPTTLWQSPSLTHWRVGENAVSTTYSAPS